MNKNTALACAFIVISAFSCSGKPVQKNEQIPPSLALGFFETFERDLNNTCKVISNNELIKNLTHLQKMDSGGSHYYPLERESLTTMIQSLSSYPYAECILMNGSGTIIYTMFENKLLSRKAEAFPSSLAILFRHCKDNEPYILDVAEFPALAGSARLYFGIPVKRGVEVEGVLVAAIAADDVAKIIKLKDNAYDKTGTVRLSRSRTDLLLTIQNLTVSDDQPHIAVLHTEQGNKPLQSVSYRNILWFMSE